MCSKYECRHHTHIIRIPASISDNKHLAIQATDAVSRASTVTTTNWWIEIFLMSKRYLHLAYDSSEIQQLSCSHRSDRTKIGTDKR